MIEDLDLYAIVRPGPYNCAEWLTGGIPQWITSKGMQIRNDSADYLAAADAYYEKILPIVAKRQIHKGGGVLVMQIENEHPAGWGTDANAYLTHLYNRSLEGCRVRRRQQLLCVSRGAPTSATRTIPRRLPTTTARRSVKPASCVKDTSP